MGKKVTSKRNFEEYYSSEGEENVINEQLNSEEIEESDIDSEELEGAEDSEEGDEEELENSGEEEEDSEGDDGEEDEEDEIEYIQRDEEVDDNDVDEDEDDEEDDEDENNEEEANNEEESSEGESDSEGSSSSGEDDVEDNIPETVNTTFSSLGLHDWLITSLKRMGIKNPSEIQSHCIPQILNGKNVVGGAKTGSGKTAAFALPILQRLADDPYGVFGLVLTPTRELAFQLAEQFAALGESLFLKYAVVVGGMDQMKQALECSRRPHIIIATPGRLADLIKSSPDAIHISRIKFLVLDEADRLLTAPFAPDLSTIFDSIPKTRQTLLFTATMTEPVLKLCENKENPPFVHLCKSDVSTVSTLKQHYIFVPGYVREAYLIALITQPKLDSLTKIIFVAKCSTCEMLKLMLIELGYKAVSLHSEMNQTDRINSLGRFRSGVAKILIATDVASRGLDIPSVQLVVNYELPRDPAEYIHRVGRTARAGRGGKAVSIVAENDVKLVHAIEEKVNIKMDEFPIKEDDVVNVLNKVSDAKRVAKVTMHDTQFGEKRRIQKMKREKLAVLRGEKKPKLKN